jgi:hypothetical protein
VLRRGPAGVRSRPTPGPAPILRGLGSAKRCRDGRREPAPFPTASRVTEPLPPRCDFVLTQPGSAGRKAGETGGPLGEGWNVAGARAHMFPPSHANALAKTLTVNARLIAPRSPAPAVRPTPPHCAVLSSASESWAPHSSGIPALRRPAK